VIGSGGAWPGARLTSVIAASLAGSRCVFLDTDPRWWSSDSWQQQEARELAEIEPHFRFSRFSDTVYEMRPLNDEAANDVSQLAACCRQTGQPNSNGIGAGDLKLARTI